MNVSLKKLGNSALHGKLFLALGVEKYLKQIFFIFVCVVAFIGANLGIDKTLHKMEENKKVLVNLKSVYVETRCELTSLNSVCKVEELLKDMGSELGIPTKKATNIR